MIFSLGECNFEGYNHMCTWMNVHGSADQFDWTIGSDGTPSPFTGPDVDHTTGSKSGKLSSIQPNFSNIFE